MISLYPDEHIILERRSFWMPIALQGVLLFFAAIAPFFFIFIFKEFLPQEAKSIVGSYQAPVLFFAFTWALVLWIVFFVRWTNYYLNVFIITNKRILDIDQLGLFARDISETRLENIQDMRVEVLGFLATTMDFGNIYIQTAGTTDEFVIKNIPTPNKIKDAISHQCEALSTSSVQNLRQKA